MGACDRQEYVWCESLWQSGVYVVCELVAGRSMCGVRACDRQEYVWCGSLWQAGVCVVWELVAVRSLCGV